MDFGWCALVVLTVVGINTIRMAMMGISESHYVMIYGTVGSTITSWMIVGATVALCLLGTRVKNQKLDTLYQVKRHGGWLQQSKKVANLKIF